MDETTIVVACCILATVVSMLLTYVFHKKLPYLRFLPTIILSIPVIFGFVLLLSPDSGGFIPEWAAGMIVLIVTAPVFLICLIYAVLLHNKV